MFGTLASLKMNEILTIIYQITCHTISMNNTRHTFLCLFDVTKLTKLCTLTTSWTTRTFYARNTPEHNEAAPYYTTSVR